MSPSETQRISAQHLPSVTRKVSHVTRDSPLKHNFVPVLQRCFNLRWQCTQLSTSKSSSSWTAHFSSWASVESPRSDLHHQPVRGTLPRLTLVSGRPASRQFQHARQQSNFHISPFTTFKNFTPNHQPPRPQLLTANTSCQFDPSPTAPPPTMNLCGPCSAPQKGSSP